MTVPKNLREGVWEPQATAARTGLHNQQAGASFGKGGAPCARPGLRTSASMEPNTDAQHHGRP